MFAEMRCGVAVILILSFSNVVFAESHVKELPIPKDAVDITYAKRRGDVRFRVPLDVKSAGDFYARQLGENKWSKVGKDNVQRNFWVQKFAKENLSLEVRVDQREGGSEVRLTPKGLLWDEDSQPRVNDIPLPKDAENVQFDDFFEKIEFSSPLKVESVARFLSDQLEQRKWATSGTDLITEKTAVMKRESGKSSLSVRIEAADTGSTVTISTRGLQWDGVKSQRRSDSSSKVAQKQSGGKTAGPPPLPKRKEKIRQGIDKLPKLPNDAVVTMNGTRIVLSNVIAYELHSRGAWFTKIVATQTPFKQDFLLAKLKETGNDEGVKIPQPFLEVELDEDDRPYRLSLVAQNVPGHGNGKELEGTALVEDGRARGTVKLANPGSFFDKVYTAEISFDIPVLTRDAVPAKRLTTAPKIASTGTLSIGEKTFKLAHTVAYEMKQFDERVTTILLTEKPINLAKLTAELQKSAQNDSDYFLFEPQVKLHIGNDDRVRSLFIWADNISISGNDEVVGEVVVEDGRARGTAKLAKAGDFFGKKYTFEVSFDVTVMPLSASPAGGTKSSGGLTAEDVNGLPLPAECTDRSSEGSRFRRVLQASVAADLKTVTDFYRRELGSREWKENTAAAKLEKQSVRLAFTKPSGSLAVEFKSRGQATSIVVVSRDSQAAKSAGIFPSAGKGRLVLGNLDTKGVTVSINKRDYPIAAGAGGEDPKTGLNLDVAPGAYTIELKRPGEKGESEKVTVSADETWGVMIAPMGGMLAFQLY